MSVWWPGLSHELENLVKQCPTCARDFTPRRQPMIPTELPDYPWQKVGTEMFHFKGAIYLLVVDYFSRYPEITKLTSTTSFEIINALKSAFSRYGIPKMVISDSGPQYSLQGFRDFVNAYNFNHVTSSPNFAQSNGQAERTVQTLSDSGPQYSLQGFRDFVNAYNFNHVTSSPNFAQSNGQAERTVQTLKKLLKESSDPYLTLYHSYPFPWCKLSPAELLMGRRLRSNIPLLQDQLTPKWKFLDEFQSENRIFKERQKSDYDRQHGVRTRLPIPDDSDVWITNGSQPTTGTVISPAREPRSYIVDTPTGQVRRNRQHLNIIPGNNETIENAERPSREPIMTRSRTGTTVLSPDRR